MNTSPSHRHEAVVIGAGQAGLAAGYYLARRGIDFTVLEARPSRRRRLARSLRLAAPVLPGPV